jgi:hypothetical protein
MRIENATSGVYRYYVNNYSKEEHITRSNAKVNLFRGTQHIGSFSVPTARYPRRYYAWHVFDMDARTGNVVLRNRIVRQVGQ